LYSIIRNVSWHLQFHSEFGGFEFVDGFGREKEEEGGCCVCWWWWVPLNGTAKKEEGDV